MKKPGSDVKRPTTKRGGVKLTPEQKAARDRRRKMFGRNLEAVLNDRQITPTQFAEETGVGRVDLYSYFRGAAYPNGENLTRMAWALSVPIERLDPALIPKKFKGLPYFTMSLREDPGYVRFTLVQPVKLTASTAHMIADLIDRDLGLKSKKA